MQRSTFLITAVGFLVLSASLVEQCDAQRRGRGGFGRGQQQDVSEMSLLAIKEVVQHLKDDFELDEEKMNKISELAQDLRDEISEERRSSMQDFRDMSDEERREAMEDMRKQAEEMNSKAFKAVKKMLDKKQLKRLSELKMQRMGTAVLHDGLFQEMLQLSDEQTSKLATVKDSHDKKRQKMMDDMLGQMRGGGGGGDREARREAMMEMREMMTDLNEKYRKETLGVLNEEQKKKLEDMQGAKFKFPQRQRQRRDT